ncbi:MAG: hypothetical protein AB7S48_14480 [Bacteroidales bacterium]
MKSLMQKSFPAILFLYISSSCVLNGNFSKDKFINDLMEYLYVLLGYGRYNKCLAIR